MAYLSSWVVTLSFQIIGHYSFWPTPWDSFLSSQTKCLVKDFIPFINLHKVLNCRGNSSLSNSSPKFSLFRRREKLIITTISCLTNIIFSPSLTTHVQLSNILAHTVELAACIAEDGIIVAKWLSSFGRMPPTFSVFFISTLLEEPCQNIKFYFQKWSSIFVKYLIWKFLIIYIVCELLMIFKVPSNFHPFVLINVVYSCCWSII